MKLVSRVCLPMATSPLSISSQNSRAPRNRAISSSCSTYEKLPPAAAGTLDSFTPCVTMPGGGQGGGARPGLPRYRSGVCGSQGGLTLLPARSDMRQASAAEDADAECACVGLGSAGPISGQAGASSKARSHGGGTAGEDPGHSRVCSKRLGVAGPAPAEGEASSGASSEDAAGRIFAGAAPMG